VILNWWLGSLNSSLKLLNIERPLHLTSELGMKLLKDLGMGIEIFKLLGLSSKNSADWESKILLLERLRIL